VTVTSKGDYHYLQLETALEEDIGEYECIVSSEAGRAAARFLLVVDNGPEEHYPPR